MDKKRTRRTTTGGHRAEGEQDGKKKARGEKERTTRGQVEDKVWRPARSRGQVAHQMRTTSGQEED